MFPQKTGSRIIEIYITTRRNRPVGNFVGILIYFGLLLIDDYILRLFVLLDAERAGADSGRLSSKHLGHYREAQSFVAPGCVTQRYFSKRCARYKSQTKAKRKHSAWSKEAKQTHRQKIYNFLNVSP